MQARRVLIPKQSFTEREPLSKRRRLLILGSTGSIGESVLSLVRDYPESFEVFGLVAGSRAAQLAEQAHIWKPRYAGIGAAQMLPDLRSRCEALKCQCIAGEQAISELAAHPDVDVVVAAIVGSGGLTAVLSALTAGKTVALANKESLVAAGPLIVEAMEQSPASRLIPIDSEHSALFQCLHGLDSREIERVVLTASGGPFLKIPLAELRTVTPAQAVRHPRWSMGAKISIDSATLMNKALEMIEAHWLFALEPERIEVVIHPQSIIHSMVKSIDGGVMAQLSVPDMRAPIAYALTYPSRRLSAVVPELDFAKCSKLEFEALDHDRFRAPALAQACMSAGAAMSAVLNAANEACVDAFVSGRIGFLDIMELNEWSLNRFSGSRFAALDELLSLQERVKREVNDIIREKF